MAAHLGEDGCGDLTGEREEGCAAGLSGVDAVADEFVSDAFGDHVGAGVASGEQQVGVACGVWGQTVAGFLIEDEPAEAGRHFDRDAVEGDQDSAVGLFGDVVVGHAQDLVQGPGEQQHEQAGDSAVVVDGVVVEEPVDAVPAVVVAHGDGRFGLGGFA